MSTELEHEAPRPKGRRLLWESWGDVRAMNVYLIIYAICCSIALTLLSFVLLSIYTRSPAILTQDMGVVEWRTTEAFKLRSDMVRQFLTTTLGQIYNVTPSDYDLTPIVSYLDPRLMDMLSGRGKETEAQRLSANERKFFNILGTKRVASSKFPKFIAVITRADETTMSDSRDNNGNVITSSKSNIIFVITYMDQRTPTPANPWGLYIVGLEKGSSEALVNVWDNALPLEGSNDKKGNKMK